MCPGTGLLSQKIERGLVAGSCRRSERARGLVTLLVCGASWWSGCRAGMWCRGAGCPGGLFGEQVAGAGEQLAGDGYLEPGDRAGR
jgi:hypothetical protein